MTTTIEDLTEVGFVALEYWGYEQGAQNGKKGHHTSKNLLVHKSVLEECRHLNYDQAEHPTIRYNLDTDKSKPIGSKVKYTWGGTHGWEAKWGAMYFDISTWYKLVQFCKTFHYDISPEVLEAHI